MSNMDKITARSELDDIGNNKELFTKLTLEQGANISGGSLLTDVYPYPIDPNNTVRVSVSPYEIFNGTENSVSFSLNGVTRILDPGDVFSFQGTSSEEVQYDQLIGPGIREVTQRLKQAGIHSFESEGDLLVLNLIGFI